ncbi:MAG: hypothetical protein KDA79_24525, partial [Planctomycetaceae bacterium]|nr:hypothetical protein [Planctomycetaceae bacterium]
MPVHRSLQHEVNRLIEQLLEQTLSAEGAARLEQLLRSSKSARKQYIDRLTLHGLLHWDGAQCGEPLEDLDHPLEQGALVCSLPDPGAESVTDGEYAAPEAGAAAADDRQLTDAAKWNLAERFGKFRNRSAVLTTVAASALLLFGGGLLAGFFLRAPASQQTAEQA